MNVRKNKKLYVVLAILIGILILVLVLRATHTTRLFDTASERQTQQETTYNTQKKAAVNDADGNVSSSDDKGDPVANPGTYTPPTNSGNITVTTTQQDNQVVISTRLNGYSDGQCSLTISANGKTTTQSATVIYQSDFSTCAGFTVPVQTLGSGKWSMDLAVTSGGTTLHKTTEVTVR